MWTLSRLGRVHCSRGDVGKAIDLCARSLALARERGVDNAVEFCAATLGAAYTLGGHTTEAIARLEEALAVGESTGALDTYTVITLGQAYLSAKRLEDASRCARKALGMCQHLSVHDAEARRPAPPRRRGGQSGAARLRGRRSALPRGPRIGRQARHASPRRPLPPRPRQAVPPNRGRREGRGAPDDRDDDVPRRWA